MQHIFPICLIAFGVLGLIWLLGTTISTFDVMAISGSSEAVSMHDSYYVVVNWTFATWVVASSILLIISGEMLRRKNTENTNGNP
jgi:hypothetical protein